jgi:hypothetical protein
VKLKKLNTVVFVITRRVACVAGFEGFAGFAAFAAFLAFSELAVRTIVLCWYYKLD